AISAHPTAQLAFVTAKLAAQSSVPTRLSKPLASPDPCLWVVKYSNNEELLAQLPMLPSSLTATIHSQPVKAEFAQEVTAVLRERAGRAIYDQYPTGVAVTWAQHHGGPWPSANTSQTSVGPTAIRRFLRPLTWQDS